MNRDTATACWYRRLDPACFTDQSSMSLYADVGSLAAPALDDRTRLWASPPSSAVTWDDASPIPDAMAHPLVTALANWFAARAGSWRLALSGQR